MSILHHATIHHLEYTENQSLLESIWSSATQKMTASDFQEQMKIYVRHLQNTRAKFVIFDLRYFFFPIVPEVQKWVDDEITSIERTIIQKQVLLMPEDFIAELGVEQTIEEMNNQALNMEFFQTREEALAWFQI